MSPKMRVLIISVAICIITCFSQFSYISIGADGTKKAVIDISKIDFKTSLEWEKNEHENILNKINAILGTGKDKDTFVNLFKVRLNNVSKEFKYEVISIIYVDDKFKLYMFGVDNDLNVKLLCTYDNEGDIINNVKVDVYYNSDYLEILSQRPFSAAYRTVVLRWNGSKFQRIYGESGDPTQEDLNKIKALIAKGEFKKAEKIEVGLYPDFYYDYNNMGVYAVKTTHKQALNQYKKKNIKKAIKTIEWGIDFYFNNDHVRFYDEEFNWRDPRNINKDKIDKCFSEMQLNKKLSLQELAAVFNDYAFFLSESNQSRKAEAYLLQVIKLNPKRVVAYINLGDVSWKLGKKAEARKYYKNYLDLLGKNKKNVPERVYERLNV